MSIKFYLVVIAAFAFMVGESLWAGYLVKAELAHRGYEISLGWTYLLCYVLLNAFDFFSKADNNLKVALRINSFGWIVIATIVLWWRGVIW